MTRPPRAGAITIHALGLIDVSGRFCTLNVCSHTRLVHSAITRSSSHAATAPPAPTQTAIATRIRTRRSVVKSPSRGKGLAEAERAIVIFRRDLIVGNRRCRLAVHKQAPVIYIVK